MAAGGFEADPATVSSVGRFLGTAKSELSTNVSAISLTPDAGSSSGEVASVLRSLGDATSGLAKKLEAISQILEAAATQYRRTDEVVESSFRSSKPKL